MVTINLFIDENDKDAFKPCYNKQLELHKFDEDHNINSYDIIMPYANIKYYDWFKNIIAKNNTIENRTKFIRFFTKLLDSMITYLNIDKNSYFYTKKNSEITKTDIDMICQAIIYRGGNVSWSDTGRIDYIYFIKDYFKELRKIY